MMTSDRFDAVVVGAGVVGLAVARELALSGRDVVVIEANQRIGEETSARNSEVIHAGIYYAVNSNKARLCVEGKRLLYDYCERNGVAHKNCGKLIVATEPAQFDTLQNYQAAAQRNGAGQLRWVERDELQDMEPAVDALAAVFSPTTGIIDSHQYMLSLQGELESLGGMIAYGTRVQSCHPEAEGIRIESSQGDFHCQSLINSAGLGAPELSQTIDPRSPAARYAIGHYYSYAATPFNRLVYPVAQAGGLGVHVTLDLAGQTRFGPDVRWIDAIDYRFDDSRRAEFIEAIRRYYPELDETRLQPGYTGIRPKLALPNSAPEDFMIRTQKDHGIAGLVNLLGIESPGLTASLALAREVVGGLRS